MLTVTELWRHPVKSMQGQCVDHMEIDKLGVVGDRRWAIRDVVTGHVLTGRRVPQLLFATGQDGAVTMPDGRVTADDAVLSEWLGRPVSLIGNDYNTRSTYEAPTDPLDGEHDWLSWQGPAGSFVDSTRTAVSLVGAASLRSWEHRRFRMNIVLAAAERIDTDQGSENDMVGRRIALGTCVLDVVKRVDRCVMITRPQPGIDRNLDVLRTINRDHGGDLGIGALVVTPGVIRLGDAITTLD